MFIAYRLGMAGEEGEGVQFVSFLILIIEQEVKQKFLFVCCVGWS